MENKYYNPNVLDEIISDYEREVSMTNTPHLKIVLEQTLHDLKKVREEVTAFRSIVKILNKC